jgi:hypothetical protein
MVGILLEANARGPFFLPYCAATSGLCVSAASAGMTVTASEGLVGCAIRFRNLSAGQAINRRI